jgi:hypothetical protein
MRGDLESDGDIASRTVSHHLAALTAPTQTAV